VLPAFTPRQVKLTKQRDEARAEGAYRGASIHVEADFAPDGALVDFEIDTHRGWRKTGLGSERDLPDAARRELDRLLGPDRATFEVSLVKAGALADGEPAFEVKGRSGDWKWEIELSASGQLLELEKERRRR